MTGGDRALPVSDPRRRRLALVVVGVAAALAPSVAAADDDASTSHRDRALAAYASGDYRGAADAFAIAYRLEGEAALLFAWAQAERKANGCDRAIQLYRDFLDTSPPDPDVEAARQGIALCEDQLSATRTHGRWYADVRAGVLTGAGGVLVAVGAGYHFATRSAIGDIAANDDAAGRAQQATSAKGTTTISFVATAGGAVLLTYGVLRYLRLRRDERARADTDAVVAPAVGPDGAGVMVYGRF